jgi:hypothetical protein
MIVSFDPSLTHFGWILFDEHKQGKDALLSHGIFKTGPSDGLPVQRIITQKERVKKLLIDNNIKFVAMEAPIWGDFNTELLYALNQFLHQVFLDLSIYVVYVQPTSLKKFAYPKLNPNTVTKHMITHQAKTELDKHGKRFAEHVADAYFIGQIGLYFYKWFFLKTVKDEELPEYLNRFFQGKHTFTRGNKKGITEYKGIIYRENDQFFDYTKHNRKTLNIQEEVKNGSN